MCNRKCSFCRRSDPDYKDVNVDQIKFFNDLKKEKCFKSLKLGKGEISSINIKELLNFGLKKLEKWPYYFLRKKPKFKKNLIPLI
jgi:aminoglycoside N3'-acetyltransferase